MKRVNQLLFGLLILGSTTITSCKKEGCTDPNALNYSVAAKKDNGSCITAEDVQNANPNPQNLYVENFSLTFNNSTSFDYYIPNFNYESGDMIVIETVNSYSEWTSLPYIFDVDTHLEGTYESDGTVWIYLKNDDGTSYFSTTSQTVSFRVGLIKHKGMILDPNIKDMTISELKTVL